MRQVVNDVVFNAKICAVVVKWRGFRWILGVIVWWCAILVGLGTNCAFADEVAAAPTVTAQAALLMDCTTGQVLYEKCGYEQLPPASTTKILTALLALDICPTEREVEVSAAAAAVGESNVGLLVGERFRLCELLDAALLKSANDACFAIAEGVAGSEPLFVRLMNLKADALGAAGASLLNTNGLPAEGHTMSCYDLAVLARYAMQNPEFAERVGSLYGKMEGGQYNRDLKNTNKLLSMNEYVTGIKTGTTNAAGACLVSSMKRDGREVIAVVLHSGDRYGDSLKLLNFGVDAFDNRPMIRQGVCLGGIKVDETDVVLSAYAENELILTLPKAAAGEEIAVRYAWREVGRAERIAAGDVLGTIAVYYRGERQGAVNLLSEAGYQPPRRYTLWNKIKGFSKAAAKIY